MGYNIDVNQLFDSSFITPKTLLLYNEALERFVMNWDEYISRMENWDQATIDPKSFVRLEHATPVTPKEYLKFADKDLLLADAHGLVNALSNAKRAINCQVTSLLAVLGLPDTGDLQAKFQQFESIGVLVPRVSKKIYKLESLLDKQFCKPGTEDVEEAINIATLFVEATEKVFQEFMDSWWITYKGGEKRSTTHQAIDGNRVYFVNEGLPQTAYSEGLYIQYDQVTGNYGVRGYLDGSEVFTTEVQCGSPLDIEFIRCSILAAYNATDIELKDIAAQFVSNVKDKARVALSVVG